VRYLSLLLVLAACGRLRFDEVPPRDAAPSDGADAAASDLTVWLRMEDDPTDGRLEDSAGGDHPAVCTSCGTATPGHIGQGTVFDAAQSEYYAIASDALLETPNAFTIALWIRLDALTGGEKYYAFGKRYDAINNSWALYVDTDDAWDFETADATPNGDYPTIAPVQIGVWTHIAMSWDNATKRAYVNGVKTLDVLPPDVAFDMRDVLLGADDDEGRGPYGFFNGAIDEVRIYNRKLSDFEIQQLADQ